MIVGTHRIAGIIFRTESTVWRPWLEEEPFERFRVDDNVVPDVRHRIHKLSTHSLAVDSLVRKEGQRLLRGVHLASVESESPLLGAPAIQERLRAAQEDRPAQVSAWVEPDHVIVYDFAHRTLDFFYTEAYGGPRDDQGPEERLRFTDGSPAADHFWMHEIELDSLTLPPLTEEKRARFIRIAEISPQVIPRLALLQSPVVRARLQPGLDGVEEMQVFNYLDGLTVWSHTHNTVDYFYPKGGGRLPHDPEARVAFNLRHVFAMFLPQFSAVMVHSSGVVRNQRAALFLAPDAGGKSTVLEHATEGLLLNDDQVIVRREGGGFVAHSTPFGAMNSGPCQARLGALFSLHKAPRFTLRPMRPADLMQKHWGDRDNFASLLPKHLKTQAFDLFYDICHQVPTYQMSFPKDHVDWDAIDAAMA